MQIAWRVPLGMLRMTRLVRRLRARLTVRLLLAVRFARPVGLAIAMRLAVTVRLPLAMGLALSLRSCAPCGAIFVHVLTRGGIYRLHFARTRALPFPVALDPMGRAVAAWGGVAGTPTTWLVAPDGRVARRWVGRPDFARLRRDVDALLPAPA